jgi:hypothetical protein
LKRILDALRILAGYVGLFWILVSDFDGFGEWFKEHAGGCL